MSHKPATKEDSQPPFRSLLSQELELLEVACVLVGNEFAVSWELASLIVRSQVPLLRWTLKGEPAPSGNKWTGLQASQFPT